jgi:transcription-repair coupling factor (superfamily II helicase)
MKLNKELFPITNKLSDVVIRGLNDTAFCHYVNEVFENNNQNIVILTPTLFEANRLLNIISSYTDKALLFPMDDFLTSMAIAISPDLEITRLETLNSLLNNDKHILITHLMGFLRFLPTKELYENKIIKIKKNDSIDPKELVSKLINNGYKRDIIVSKTTDIAVRGYVVDIFPVSSLNPVRIEFFGDEVDSIRYFDPETQKSIEELNDIEIYPASEYLLENDGDCEEKHHMISVYNKKISSIIDYLPDSLLFIKDYPQVKNVLKEIKEQIKDYHDEKDKNYDGKYMHSLKIIDNHEKVYYLSHDSLLNDVNVSKTIDFKTKEVPKFHENIDAITNYIESNYNKTIIICLKKYQIKAFTKNVDLNYIITDVDHIFEGKINIIELELDDGFEYQDYIIITDKDLFDIRRDKKKYKTKFKYSTKIRDINKLELGDFIVHNTCGIGIYNGIKTLSLNDIKKDYVELLYKNSDKLYIPVEKIDLISKYSAKDGVSPRISSLSGTDWQKTKLRVQTKVHNIASELIRIYAERQVQQGFKYAPDEELQTMFESEFEYTLTDDQIVAIKQIKEEMETSHPMDRLLCGDVGFGKTEVAFRAIFKAIMNGKQVIYLCPTTILSMQQYNSAVERFKNYPVNIGLLNRFVTSKKTNEIIDGVNKGTVDLLIGTHKVLNDAIKPKNLGLLIIDEEQRFGVTHKEKIKKYKSNVDVLTLTATPIPRTLQMSLVGIRSLSLITTPPINRFPIQTYVVEENNALIKDAIYKELARNGQVFILYNHVDLIEHKVYEIQSLVPEAKIIYAHGQMNREDIENKMMDFIDHKADILVCTTIIETGIDIPNVNTLIILEADHFGLSQLYQIRGRVGRSDKIAYAYMMYKPGKVLGEEAIKRLKTIEEFTELGSGFKIAMRDLSIRGAGDILGSEQAGFIDSIGIDLYMKILNEEVARLKGEPIKDEELRDEKPLINVETHISDEYVDDNNLKIEIHKKINEIDSYDKLLEIKSELEDRFGKVDEKVTTYMYEEWFESLARTYQVEEVHQTKNSIELIFSEEMSNKIDTEKMFVDAFNLSRMIRFQLKHNHLILILDTIKLEENYIMLLTKMLEKIQLKTQ